MYEVEMKVRARHDDVRDRLQALAGTCEGIVCQADTYYDAPHRSFEATDEALRVRRVTTLDHDEYREDRRDEDVATTGARRDADAATARECRDADAATAGERRDADDTEVEARITYKGPRVDDVSKTRREVETSVGDGGDAGAVFEALGFEAVATVEKRREHWSVEDVTVTLDDVAGLGEFVEAEIETDGDLDDARATVADVLRELDLDPAAQIRTSYLGLLLEDADTDA